MMKKISKLHLALLLLLLMSLPVTVLAESAGNNTASHTVEGKTYPYLRQIEAEEDISEDEMTLYFVDGGDIPYVALSEYMQFLSGLFKDLEKGDITYEIEKRRDGNGITFQVTRPDNQSALLIDPAQDIMIFDNFNSFIQAAGTKALVSAMDIPEEEMVDVITLLKKLHGYPETDPEIQEQAADTIEEETETDEITDTGNEEDVTDAGNEENEEDVTDAGDEEAEEDVTDAGNEENEDEPRMFAIKYGEYLNRAGDAVMLNLSDYEIDIIASDDECYIPFQTMNDLLENHTYVLYVFDGEKVLGSGADCDLINAMDSAPKHYMSKEFALFNYNELRLLLDCKYGLKPEHGIEDFETFLNINTYLVSDLVSTDPMRASLSLIKLTSLYFDDLHSGFIRGSYLCKRDPGIEAQVEAVYEGPSRRKYAELDDIFKYARKEVYGNQVPGYEEVGDTAFITFDIFDRNRENYYEPGIDRDQPQDTIDLIIYAHKQIKREDSPVKNIVLDLSNNYGGAFSSAIFVISWFLGEADIALRDVFTGAETNAMYLADVNLDGEFNEDDTVGTGYKLYCLTSNCSFSCGNLVPAACKSSGKVTLVGQTTGGGSCVVLPCTTAAGAVFRISGSMQISIIQNGSFYNTDSGIVPHFFLDKPESYYDRPALAEYLRELK
ncbi:MAG: hypothetical protein IJ899_11880 [Blautia sp.]|nr:hypothetical protein [Blautia sp.]